ncbi:MAG: hypothetical protein WA175_00645 [Candidatus Acidiferrales bacterium]
MILQIQLPSRRGQGALIAYLPKGIIKNGECAGMPKFHELAGSLVKNKNSAVPVPPLLIGDLNSKLFADCLLQMFAFLLSAAAVNGIPAELAKFAVIRRE